MFRLAVSDCRGIRSTTGIAANTSAEFRVRLFMIRLFAAVIAILTLTAAASPVHASDDSAGTASSMGTLPTNPGHSLSRPKVLPPLYVSYAALQAFDAYSTQQALARGAREANPLMQPVVGNRTAFWAVKATATLATIAAAEHLWKHKRHPKAAIAVLVASNAVAAVVAARNASVLRGKP
jgi:hypothetical protein